MKKNNKGFTLVELLIVVAIIGIIAAIAIPNLLDAMNRSRHKRSGGDMRSIGMGIESYKVDYAGRVPAANDITGCISVLRAANYVSQVASVDGWGTLFQWTEGSTDNKGVFTQMLNDPASTSYRIGSPANDVAANPNVADLDADTSAITASGNVQAREMRNWDCDIIFGDGNFFFGACS